ncbi:MAG: valine--tRNA ligase [Candidatus Nealsonbacteria bacterium]
MEELSKSYNPKETEDKIYRLWEKSGFFNPDKLPKNHKIPYTIVIPPPNVTGELHMGHALNTVIQDILIRSKRMQGLKTLWVPGTDHAGIATQNVVEKKLKKEDKTRFDFGREEFIKEVWKWKKEYGDKILNQLKKMGASCDWSRTRFTMDDNYAKAVKQAFLHYHKKGLIYQGERVVNWCPRCATSLSDLELVYKEIKGKLWYIKYKLENKKLKTKYIIVATTRPETMLGDTAVAVNPKDQRYKNLMGEKVILPLANKEIPIITDRLIDKDFGTGAVKVTPAHSLVDYEIGQNHKLKSVKIIDEKGKITKQAPTQYQGLKITEAREKVIEDLEKQNIIEKIEDYNHQVPKCYRCNTTIELIPSLQWFLKMDKLAKMAEKSVKNGKIKLHPKNFEKSYFDWLKNIKDWCISRQIWWGHRLPVWQSEIKNQNAKIKNLDSKTYKKDIYVGDNPPKGYEQSNDVLDTWFSSALWPFAVLGWPDSKIKNQKSKIKNDLETFYPTNVLSTARDIMNLWVVRMIFSGMEFMNKEPFNDVYIHATVLTLNGKRMSKSLGTGIDPLKLIDIYGSDAVRFGISFQIMGNQDIKFTEDNIIMGKKFCNKIWNASRFVLQQIKSSDIKITQPKDKNLTIADKKILNQLNKTIKSIDSDLKKFQFGKASHTLYDFFWHDFCDCYIEKSKNQNNKETEQILLYVLLNSLILLHPFIPFITEEIYQKLPIKDKKESLMIEKWPRSNNL